MEIGSHTYPRLPQSPCSWPPYLGNIGHLLLGRRCTSHDCVNLHVNPLQSIPVPVQKAASIHTALNGATNFQSVTKPNARHPANGIIHSISIPSSIHPRHTNLCALKSELKLTDLPLNSLTEQSTEIQSTWLQCNPVGVGLPIHGKVGTSWTCLPRLAPKLTIKGTKIVAN
jgi:hypothetical protein